MRIKLKVPAFINGHLHSAGDIVSLPEGQKGPHRIKGGEHERIDYGVNPPIDANRELPEQQEEPLYEEVHDPAPPSPADERAALEARREAKVKELAAIDREIEDHVVAHQPAEADHKPPADPSAPPPPAS